MASITIETVVGANADTVWRSLAATGDAHRVFAPVLTDSRAEGDDARVVTFANGLVVRERILDLDHASRRIAYTVTSGGFEHHAAAMRVEPAGEQTCRFIWITDVLPHAAAERIRPLMEAGAAALKANFEGPGSPGAPPA